jgi:hypothetical protein
MNISENPKSVHSTEIDFNEKPDLSGELMEAFKFQVAGLLPADFGIRWSRNNVYSDAERSVYSPGDNPDREYWVLSTGFRLKGARLTECSADISRINRSLKPGGFSAAARSAFDGLKINKIFEYQVYHVSLQLNRPDNVVIQPDLCRVASNGKYFTRPAVRFEADTFYDSNSNSGGIKLLATKALLTVYMDGTVRDIERKSPNLREFREFFGLYGSLSYQEQIKFVRDMLTEPAKRS